MVYEPVWKLGEVLWKEIKKPHIIVEEIRVENFRYPSNWGEHFRRFIIARIRNKGKERAENCLAHLETPSIPEREFKLHWVDIPYEPRRDTAKKIDLEPQEAIDLDIVFSVCGGNPPKIQTQPELTSNTIHFYQPEPRPSITSDPSLTRGTYDVSLYQPRSTDSSKIIDARLPANRQFAGAWVANPYALYNPEGYREAFLPPGKHEISVDILLSYGTGCGFICIIESTEEPYHLNFDPDRVKIPGT